MNHVKFYVQIKTCSVIFKSFTRDANFKILFMPLKFSVFIFG